MSKRMRVYRAKDGWRWQLWSSSDIVAESGESHPDRGYAVKKAQEFMPEDAELEVDPADLEDA